MAMASLGTKRDCPKCSAKFYDLNATPIVCPKCGHTLKLTTSGKPKAVPKKAEPARPKKIAVKPLAEDDDGLDASDSAGAELEDLEELDDAPEVISLEEVEDHQEEAEVDPNSDDAEDGMFLEELEDETNLFDPLDEEEELDDDEAEEDDDQDDVRPRRNPR